jgi:5-methyltetrahydropteroyltriglutamate--homocysteine methyltransferase
MDVENPGVAMDRTGHPNPVPRVAGPLRRTRRVLARDLSFLLLQTQRPVKVTIPGPFTMSQQAQDDHYGDEEELAMALAAAVNEEVKDLFAAGADVVQLDEPYLQARAEKARRFAVPVINRALEGVEGTTALHTCFGYAHIVHDRPRGYPFLEELSDTSVDQISLESAQQKVDLSILESIPGKQVMLGVLDLADDAPVEDAQVVASRIREALRHVPPERLLVAPDCGMKYLPRDRAYAKLEALSRGAAEVRAELMR